MMFGKIYSNFETKETRVLMEQDYQFHKSIFKLNIGANNVKKQFILKNNKLK